MWGSASNCNLENLQRFQSKVLRIITDDPWYVQNAVIKRTYKCYRFDKKYEITVSPADRSPTITPNSLAKSFLQGTNYSHRFKRYYPADLATRF